MRGSYDVGFLYGEPRITGIMGNGETKIWSRLQPHGGTTVPKEVRDFLGLKSGDIVLWEKVPEIGIRVVKGSVKEVSQEWPHKTSK